MASELKPCPFCGGADVNLYHSAKTFMSWVSCKSCGLDAPSETGITDEEAITYWNTRPAPAATDTGLEIVGYTNKNYTSIWRGEQCCNPEYKIAVVTRSQAEELLAAKDEVIGRHREAQVILGKQLNEVIADNAALTARVKELELQLSASKETAKIKRVEYLDLDQDHSELKADYAVSEAQLKAAKKALEPFAAVLENYDPDWEDDDVTAVLVAGSVTHYGITLGDFRKARAVLGGKPS